jgi:hypothetical protein
MSVAAHYRKKLEKDDLKRLSKEVCIPILSNVLLSNSPSR